MAMLVYRRVYLGQEFHHLSRKMDLDTSRIPEVFGGWDGWLSFWVGNMFLYEWYYGTWNIPGQNEDAFGWEGFQTVCSGWEDVCFFPLFTLHQNRRFGIRSSNLFLGNLRWNCGTMTIDSMNRLMEYTAPGPWNFTHSNMIVPVMSLICSYVVADATIPRVTRSHRTCEEGGPWYSCRWETLRVIKDTETDDFCRVPSSCTYVFQIQIRCVFLLGDMMCTNINIHICIYIYIYISVYLHNSTHTLYHLRCLFTLVQLYE